jgi:hypothetical protein
VRVAVALGDDGKLSELPASSAVAFYVGEGASWREEGRVPFSFSGVSGLCSMRKRLHEYIGVLGEADAILALSFPGVSRDVLSRAGPTLYEAPVFEPKVLEGIHEHALKGGGEGEAVPVRPFEREPGSGAYYLDLRLALNANPDLTTKKVLRPFFQSTSFTELDFVYDHFPPWLPGELKALGYAYKSFDLKSGVLVRVYGGAACGRKE